MAVGTIFTLFILPSIYYLLAASHRPSPETYLADAFTEQTAGTA